MTGKDGYGVIEELISSCDERNFNEADTRHKIIDVVLHDFWAWPRNRVSVEEYINPGYADYILKKENGEDLVFLEAKKEGVFFELPIPYNNEENACYIPIKKLISDRNIQAALQQVRAYCFDTGCEYAAITNGHEWIFFKTFEKGKRWDELQAFVIRRLEFFIKEYTKAVNNLSFIAITERLSLASLLSTSLSKDRDIYYPKEKIPSYSHKINSNRLAAHLRPLANYYFGVIIDDDPDFMDKCYVSRREYKNTFDEMQDLIQDSLTPYFEEYGVQQLEDTGKGGQIGGRISKNIRKGRKGEVLVLFGGKGAGKSTFIKRLLHHNPPRWLKDHSVISIVDLLQVPPEKNVIREYIWKSLVEKLDMLSLLKDERDALLDGLFKDRYVVAKKQDLAGLDEKSESYNLRLNELFSVWKKDYAYCAEKLTEHWRSEGKGIIVVVDNTDQYPSEIQDFCFTSAQEISKLLSSIVVISMREERFYDSKIHGVLDAFQNSGFHISSPDPAEVFKKRLQYTSVMMGDDSKREELVGELDPLVVKDCISYLRILNEQFSNFGSPLTKFLRACSHGDTRLSLELFRSFMLSGYTNVDEMINAGSWRFKIHQVIKPVMIPDRYFYDEGLSNIPNIFQLRSNRATSHFTALRILRKISKGSDKTTPAYHSMANLRSYFSDTFGMVEDFERNIDVLLKHSFIEANNRIDEYTDKVDSIKITNYGLYMVRELSYYFTYLDVVCTDCGFFDQPFSNYLVGAAKDEYSLFIKSERLERIRVRLNRVEKLIEYLTAEELREKETYSLGMPNEELFTFRMKKDFDNEKKEVMRSAKKQKSKRTNGRLR